MTPSRPLPADFGLPAEPPRLTRRRFLGGSAAGAVALGLAACSPGPTPKPSPSPSPTPTPTPAPPAGYFEALAELRDAIRRSPDHLVAEADRLVEAGDVEAVVRFVREQIATYPAAASGTGDPIRGRRWGTRATLRGGAGTPREKADLLAELLGRAGFEAEVVGVAVDDQDGKGLFGPPARRSPIEPDIADDRLALLRRVMGLAPQVSAPEPIDPNGRDAARLADDLLGHFPTPPEASEPFDARAIASLPMVRIATGDGRLADPVTDRGLAPIGDAVVPAAPSAGEPLEVRVLVEAARTSAPHERFTLVEGSWTADDLVGRRLFVAFSPPAESLEELLLVRPRDVGVVVPSLTVRGHDLDPEATRALAVSGTAVTLGGDLVDTEDPSGNVRVGDAVVGPAGPPDPAAVARVRTLEVVASPAGFPAVGLGVRALAADGSFVEGLPATAFRVIDEDVPVGFVLERSSAPAPRVLLLLDGSSSIPAEFRGAGAATVARRLAERLAAADPRTLFRVAMVSAEKAEPSGNWTADLDELARQATARSGYGSQLWESLADAAKLGATAIVFVTDGQATDAAGTALTAPPAAHEAQVRIGPRTVTVGVGPVDSAGLDALGAAGRLGAFPVSDQEAAIDAVATALSAAPEPPYRFRYHAPSDEPPTRTVRVELLGTSVAGSAAYEVPPPDARARPPGLSGLFLTVRVGSTSARRVLAGIDADQPSAPVSRLDVERVRHALFDTTVLEIEGAVPPPAVLLDERYTAILALQPLAEAADRAGRLEALATLAGGGPTLEPATLQSLTVPLPDSEAFVFESGLRVVLHRESIVPGTDGRAIHRRAVDLLPSARFAAVEPDARAAFAATARATARLALVEAAVFPTSTLTVLGPETLAAVDRSLYDVLAAADRPVADAMNAAVGPWRETRPRLVIPADGTPTAAWVFDGRTGSLVGVLADSSGGGSEEEAIEHTFDTAESLISGAGIASDIAAAAGLGGFSFAGGVWLTLEKTKLQKLKAATLMLATLRPPEDDIADLSGLGCDLAAAAAFEAAGRAAGAMFGEAGSRAASAASAADGVTSTICG